MCLDFHDYFYLNDATDVFRVPCIYIFIFCFQTQDGFTESQIQGKDSSLL